LMFRAKTFFTIVDRAGDTWGLQFGNPLEYRT
jgi:hypothetical protein